MLFLCLSSMASKQIWTIGHSTRTIDEFVQILQSFNIKFLADIRRYPGSRRYPHFNREALEKALWNHKIDYGHFESLGGRRSPHKDTKNTAWRLAAFRGYADYMETAEFKEGISNLKKVALQQRTVYMCSEAVWWSCHRSLVSDYLKSLGWEVIHIMGLNKSEEHPYTKPARIVNGKLSYSASAPGLFD